MTKYDFPEKFMICHILGCPSDLFICKTIPIRKQATCSLKEKWLISLIGEPGSIPGRSRCCIKDFF